MWCWREGEGEKVWGGERERERGRRWGEMKGEGGREGELVRWLAVLQCVLTHDATEWRALE